MQRICSVLLIGCVVVLIVCSVLKTRALFWKSCLSNPKKLYNENRKYKSNNYFKQKKKRS